MFYPQIKKVLFLAVTFSIIVTGCGDIGEKGSNLNSSKDIVVESCYHDGRIDRMWAILCKSNRKHSACNPLIQDRKQANDNLGENIHSACQRFKQSRSKNTRDKAWDSYRKGVDAANSINLRI